MINLHEKNVGVPQVSIIVTTYNRVAFLKKTVDSILAQSFIDFELIIVDNMSVDETSKFILDITDSRIKYFKNPNFGVIAVNRNYGINEAKGMYIAFCDDDDLWLPNKLKLQVDFLQKNNTMALCYTNAESFSGEKETISKMMVRRIVKKHHFIQLLRGNFIPNSSVLLRRKIFLELGLLNENPSLREDYEMWLRVANKYPIGGINLALIKYRYHLNNIASNRAIETLRAIRTVRATTATLDIPIYVTLPSIAFQYIKYFIYKIIRYRQS